MEDTTKVGLTVGGIGALVGAIATFIAYKEGHASGHASGLAEGIATAGSKYEALKRQIAEYEEQVASLRRERDAVLQNLNQRYAYVDSFLDLIRAQNLITEDTYAKLINSTARQRNELFLNVVDVATSQDDQACKILQGKQGYGTIDVSLLEKQQSVGVPIVFSAKVRGVYRWPQRMGASLPEDETILASSALFSKIRDLIPGWEMESYGRSRDRQQYDYACICRNALKELDKRQILCDGISYDEDGYEYVNGKIICRIPSLLMDPNDYVQLRPVELLLYDEKSLLESKFRVENECGVITSSQLDDYIKQKCEYVQNAIAAFVTTNLDCDELARARKTLRMINQSEPIEGVLEFMGDTPVIRFCNDICVSVPFLSWVQPLYFEGDGLSVFSNADLRILVEQLVPRWRERPVSDARVDGKLNQYYLPPEQRRELRRMYNSSSYWPVQPQPDYKMPAPGAAREWLRFCDASEALCRDILQRHAGQRFTCEKVTLKRTDGFISTSESSVDSIMLRNLLRDAVGAAQKNLNDFAIGHNAVLFSDGDLFPLVKSKQYYHKWERLNRIMTAPGVRIGDVVKGVVRKIVQYGAFVDLPNGSGLVHISEISDRFVKDVHSFLSEGQVVSVKVFAIDSEGRLKLSIKRLGNSPT